METNEEQLHRLIDTAIGWGGDMSKSELVQTIIVAKHYIRKLEATLESERNRNGIDGKALTKEPDQ